MFCKIKLLQSETSSSRFALVSFVQQAPLFHFTAHLLLVKRGSKDSRCLQLYSQSCRSKVARRFTSKELLYITSQCFSNMSFQQKYWPKAHLIWILPGSNDIHISDPFSRLFSSRDSTLPVSSSRLKQWKKENISPIPVHQTTTGTIRWEGQWENGLLDDN